MPAISPYTLCLLPFTSLMLQSTNKPLNGEMDLKIHQKVDKTLQEISSKLTILMYLEATNSQEEKRGFLEGKTENPKFKYRAPHYDTKGVNVTLTQLEPSNDELGKLLRDKIKELRLKNEIIANLGNEEITRKASKELFCEPSRDLINKAKKRVEKWAQNKSLHTNEDQNLKAEQIAKKLKSYLDKTGMEHWKVVESKRSSASVSKTARTIKISTYKKYSKQAIERLKIHEINVHVLRAENGKRQKLNIFASGLPNYLPTEEGIAAYLEEKFNVASPVSNVRFPLRVLAVNAVNDNLTFRECFEQLRSFGVDDDLCWETTYRAFRGGGYLKDHVYLEGYYKIKDFVENGGNLEDLYIGKIGLEHLELCKQLVKDGILKPPKYLPTC